MSSSSCIGLDIGHSTVKVSFAGITGPSSFIFPSVVCPSFLISDDAEARRAASETVTVGSRSFFIGDTARIQGGTSVSTGLSEDWIDSPEHAALLLGAFAKLRELLVDVSSPDLVMGLPTHLFLRQKDRLKEIVRRHVKVNSIRVIPQPMGPYQAYMLAPNGLPAISRLMTKESWGVIEVGYFSTDFMLIQDGRWMERASGACSGVRVAAEHLVRLLSEKGITIDLLEAEDALRNGFIRSFGQKMDVTAEVSKSSDLIVAEVVDTATRLMEPYARKLDGVLVAGGGAPLVYPLLKARWPHAVMLDNPRFAVAEGMRRLGLALSFVRNISKEPVA
ncbi:MAG: ParM/StbA family protein [Anaerolineae bacterium]|nr:ParM/StbA family protein [Anaerolineae bacterium]